MLKGECATHALLENIRACKHCTMSTPPLPVTPFTDASGDRLRDWMGVSSEEFYNSDLIAVTPMGFCFPGQDDKGGDLPPRNECGCMPSNGIWATVQNVILRKQ